MGKHDLLHKTPQVMCDIHMGRWSVTCYHAGLGVILCMYPSVIIEISYFEGAKKSFLFFIYDFCEVTGHRLSENVPPVQHP